MGVKNKPFPWFSSISSTRIDESTKALCFLCGCNQGKISRLPYNHILALKPCLLENFRATTSCTASPFLPLPTQTTLSNIPVIPLTAPFFVWVSLSLFLIWTSVFPEILSSVFTAHLPWLIILILINHHTFVNGSLIYTLIPDLSSSALCIWLTTEQLHLVIPQVHTCICQNKFVYVIVTSNSKISAV